MSEKSDGGIFAKTTENLLLMEINVSIFRNKKSIASFKLFSPTLFYFILFYFIFKKSGTRV